MQIRRSLRLTVASACSPCGGDCARCLRRQQQPSSSSDTAAKYAPVTAPPDNAKKGGTLTVIAAGDVDYIDPGAAYYQFTYMIDRGHADSALMGWPPNDTATPSPLISRAAQPTISNDGKTVTFKIKPNITYSPPLGGGTGWSRPVVSADVKYAIERGLLPGVPNGYLSAVLRRPRRASRRPRRRSRRTRPRRRTSAASTTPDDLDDRLQADQAVVDRRDRRAVAADRARRSRRSTRRSTTRRPRLDLRRASDATSGRTTSRATSPASRSPWSATRTDTAGSDFRPAYLDKVVVQEGFSDTELRRQEDPDRHRAWSTSTSRSDRRALKLAATQYPKQLHADPVGRQPLRRAEHAEAAVQQHQRPQGGDRGVEPRRAAEHARRRRSTGAGRDALHPAGHPGLRAGRRNRRPDESRLPPEPERRHGAGRVVHEEGRLLERQVRGQLRRSRMVSDNSPPGSDTAQVVKAQLTQLGFNVSLQPVDARRHVHEVLLGRSDERPNVCPNVGWVQGLQRRPGDDRPDVQRRRRSCPTNNSNWPQLNDPAINDALEQGEADHRPDAARPDVRQDRRRDHGAGAGDPVDLGQRDEHRLAATLPG